MPRPSFALTSRISSAIGADEIVQLLLAPLGLGAGQIDLVQDGDDLEAGVHRQKEIRQRLRLNALRRVDDENRALAGGERPRDFVGEVDVPRRVDEVELVVLAAVGAIRHPDGVELDRDAALALEVERVEHLRLHLALLQHARGFDQPVGQASTCRDRYVRRCRSCGCARASLRPWRAGSMATTQYSRAPEYAAAWPGASPARDSARPNPRQLPPLARSARHLTPTSLSPHHQNVRR